VGYRAAGVEQQGYDTLRPRNVDVLRKLFDRVLANVGDHGFREWRAFDHPQLGAGQIVEQGSHADLIAPGGTYARLYKANPASFDDVSV